MERKLASLQRINKIYPIPKADRIERATLCNLAWNMVIQKERFNEGDLCVYIEIDSVPPKNSEIFSFLPKDEETGEYKPVKTKKLRGVTSQGILFKPEEFEELKGLNLNIGDDLTQILGIKKDEEEINWDDTNILGKHPYFFPKSNETRIQSIPDIIDELKGKPYVMTLKVDGENLSIYDGGVCTHDVELARSDNKYWQIVKKYNLEETLNGKNLAIIGEFAGPGIKRNRANLEEKQLFVFDIFDIENYRYFSFDEINSFCQKHNLTSVPVLKTGNSFNYTVEELINLATTFGSTVEGFVCRPLEEIISDSTGERLSFKVINNEYLLKE